MDVVTKTIIKMGKIKLGLWGVLALTFLYLFIVGLYFEYIINREVDILVQYLFSFVVLYYTVFQIKLIFNSLFKFNSKKEKE
jgi:uncharacterized membrane protein YjjP (DUF1212 family)